MATNQPFHDSQKFLVVGGYTALIAAFVLFGVVPIVRGMSATQAQLVENKAEIASRQSKKQQLQEVKQLVNSITLDTRDYERLVPANLELSSFLSQVYKEWDAAGMKDVS